MRFGFVCVAFAALFAEAAVAKPVEFPLRELTEQSIDAADFDGWRSRVDSWTAAQEAKSKPTGRKRSAPPPAEPKRPEPDPFLVHVQVLLDRAHVSPGVIDGRLGDNLTKAVQAFEEARGLPVDGEIDADVWKALSADQGKATKTYEITQADIDGKYVETVPKDYAKLARLKWIGFRGPAEMLAERFHMDERLLRALNPKVSFKSAGETILVADVGAAPTAKVAKIVVEKKKGDLRAFDDAGKLVFVAPATVGSSDTPSPEGTMKVNGAFPNPYYKYDPKKNFQQGRNTRKLLLKPGPNGPVGSMWIDLAKPTYGIHGTPEPNDISKTNSHGCVRLTNWDAAELASMIQPKRTMVEFR
ncbi:L,D-transpeptidase family protein [Chelatococcus sambhunathii]|uniref:L,D-transpeptidase family protein n=1 Tax=Chelatococcus sambhunathii TaxID=363953 RepID=UPI0028528037|nr:L,D-transpeptidase [Chelatococcus sambhunathii]